MTITPQEALTYCIEHREIFHGEMLHSMRFIMHGEIPPVVAATLTVRLRVRKETIGEIAAAATVMREFATKVGVPAEASDYFVDIVDTDGDGANTSNISTASMLVAAAVDAYIAKHNGYGVSSKLGGADILEALDVNIMLMPGRVAESIETIGIDFIFAPNHRPAMGNVAPIRKELGVHTIFNVLGPLTSPADTPNALMGVFHPDLVGIQVRVMQRLDTKHTVVVYGKNGMDEVLLGTATLVRELKNDAVTEYEIHPKDFGLQMVSNRSLKVTDADESKTMLIEALEDKPGMPCEIVSLNADVALYAADIAGSIGDGMKLTREAIASDAAHARLGELVRVTNQFKA